MLDVSELSLDMSDIIKLIIITQKPVTVSEEVRILLVKRGNCTSASGMIMTSKLIEVSITIHVWR